MEAIVGAIIGAAVTLAGTWWFWRRRWQPKQHEMLSRAVKSAEAAINAIESGAEYDRDEFRLLCAEAETLIPGRLFRRLIRLRSDLQLADAYATMRTGARDNEEQDRMLAMDARMREQLKSAKAERQALLVEMRKHFGLGSIV